MNQINIGLAGLGTIGAGVYECLRQNRVLLVERLGLELNIRRVAVKNRDLVRSVNPQPELLTDRWEEVVDDPHVEIAVELMGGIEVPYQFVTRALDAGKVVVTGTRRYWQSGARRFSSVPQQKGFPFFRSRRRRRNPHHQVHSRRVRWETTFNGSMRS
jgi:homoserine dehydrogenase